jgi:DNA-binding NarL/FixJ family response regulator
MIVDDHPLWRDTLRQVLEERGVGYVVAQASDGPEAVELLRAAQPDVVVMDIQLPTMTGVEATRELVAAQPDVKVLVLSSSDHRRDVVEAVRAGATGYLVKTAESPAVAEAVTRVHRGELVFPPTVAGAVLDELRRERVEVTGKQR